MNVFKAIGHALVGLGKLIGKGLAASKVDDVAVELALKWVKVAAGKFADNAEKREWVVQVLIGKGLPESVARLAVELAYQVYKKEMADGAI